MKEASKYIIRIVLKSVFVAMILFILVYAFDTIRDEVYYARSLKESRPDTVSPVVRGAEDYKITEDSVFIKRLEDSTKELLK